MYKIYKITNLVNSKLYIGLTKQDLRRRFIQHARAVIHNVSAIKTAIQKYGEENFTIEQIDIAETLDEAYHLERYYMEILNTVSPHGYNLHEGGTGGHISPEIRKKMAKGIKEWYSKNNHPNKGGTLSEEHKVKLSKAHKGKKPSKETIEKIRKANSGVNAYWYGKKADEMPFGNMGGWNKGIPMKQEAKEKRLITRFYNGIEDIFERGLKLNTMNHQEVEHMRKRLTDNYFDVVVSFFYYQNPRC